MVKYTLALVVLLGSISSETLRASDALDPKQIATRIDNRLETQWKSFGVAAAEPADDATFLRRASLDLVGRIPTAAEVREFLRDDSSEKDLRLVRRLIHSGAHSRHMATFWRRTWIPQADTAEFAQLADDFETWLTIRLQEKTPYDRLANEMLTWSDTPAKRSELSPANFYLASEFQPETLAANAARALLGVNLDCAQCHDHPFARWTRDQFWETAAFFAPVQRGQSREVELPRITIPETTRSLAPRLLSDETINWPQPLNEGAVRRVFAEWVTGERNPYFAKNAVNRLWAHFFGSALVEPVDDLSSDAAAEGQHAALLDELAECFVASGYDLQLLTEALVQTKAYRLSAIAPGKSPLQHPPAGDDPPAPHTSYASNLDYFAQRRIVGLTGEQLYESLRTAAGLPPERTDLGRGAPLEARKQFCSLFYIERPVAAERSISQALALMNSPLIADITRPEVNQTLAGILNAPFLNQRERIETLFLAVLSRPPSERELEVVTRTIQGRPESERAQAYSDLFWVLINSTEFNTNH